MQEVTKKRFENFSNFLGVAEKYKLKLLPDGKIWTVKNLKEEVEGADWDKSRHYYLYNFQEANQVVLPGFHLPSVQEFTTLLDALHIENGAKQSIKTLQALEEFGFEDGYWWTSTKAKNDNACCFAVIGTRVVCPSIGYKDCLCPIRLIQD